jgi:hypothetical protein
MTSLPIGVRALNPRIPREVAALMLALQLRSSSRVPLRDLTDAEWESLLQFCDVAHLTLSLAQLERDGFPSWVAEHLEINLRDNAARFDRVKATYREAAAALDKAQVECIVLKGFAQAPDYVNDPRLRMQSDLDLYCPQHMIQGAQAALQSIGYEPEETLDYSRADHLPSMIRPGDWQWRGNPFDPDMPLSIELHFTLWNESVSFLPVPEVDSFWERRTKRVIDGVAFPALSSVDHLGYLAIHILRNLIAGDWVLHHIHELATFLHAHADDDMFWKAWKETHSSSLRAMETIALCLARSWFSCDVHEELEREIICLPVGLTMWLQRFPASSIEGMFRQNKDWVWLHFALLKSRTKKRQLLRRALIPRRIPRRNEPVVRLENRQPRRFRIAHPSGRYISYLASRLTAHAHVVPATLFRGLGWWLSQRQLGT